MTSLFWGWPSLSGGGHAPLGVTLPILGVVVMFGGFLSPAGGCCCPFWGRLSLFWGWWTYSGDSSPHFGDVYPHFGTSYPCFGDSGCILGMVIPVGDSGPILGTIYPHFGDGYSHFGGSGPILGLAPPVSGMAAPFWRQLSPFQGEIHGPALPRPPHLCVIPPPPGAGGAEGLAPARVHGNAGVGASASQGVHHDLPRGALRGDWYGAGATPFHPPNPGYVSGDTTGCQAHLGVPCPLPTGSGTSKKLAKRNAAAKMLVRIHNVPMEPREGSEAEVEEDQFSMVLAGEGLMGDTGTPRPPRGG